MFKLISAGQVIVGASLSVTITSKLHSAVSPAPSVAVYVTVVVPTGKVAPGLKLLVSEAIVQLSPAIGCVQLTTALHLSASLLIDISVGHDEKVGGVVSVPIITVATA